MNTNDEWAALALIDCSTCGTAMPFETLDCPDGHDDCPDHVCTGCGAVVVVGLSPLALHRTA